MRQTKCMYLINRLFEFYVKFHKFMFQGSCKVCNENQKINDWRLMSTLTKERNV